MSVSVDLTMVMRNMEGASLNRTASVLTDAGETSSKYVEDTGQFLCFEQVTPILFWFLNL